MTDSPYAHPRPYDSPEMERFAIEGRIKTAAKIRDICAKAGEPDRAARWQGTVDQLLEHLAYIDDRAATAAMDRASAEGSSGVGSQ